jgi:hypothetical protein
MSERTASRGDARVERQQSMSDRTSDRQQGRTERTESRQDTQADRTQGRQDLQANRQQEITQRQQNRQGYAQGSREDWQDYHNDWDNWDNLGGYVAAGAAVAAGAYVVGTIVNAASYSAMSCTPTNVVVNGITYSQCGSTWYQPTYSGSDVSYVVVNPPPGY